MSGNKKKTKEKEAKQDVQQEHFKQPLDQMKPSVIAKPKYLKNASYSEAIATTMTTTVNSLLSYLPSSVSKSLPVATEESTSPKIIWAHFQSIDFKRTWSEKPSVRNLYLILGYSDGVQIWDCSNLEEIKAILSIKCGPSRCAKILENPFPQKNESDPWVASRPHLAIVTNDSGQKNSACIKIYSLRTGDTVHLFRFKSEIFNIYSNGYLVVACAKDNIFSFDARTYSSAFHIGSCEPNPHTGSSVAALGTRWLAYATSHPVSKQMKDNGNTRTQEPISSHVVMDAAKGVAAGVASNLIYWGDKGINAVSGYFANQEVKKPNTIHSANHGTIIIRDVVTRSIVANFQCHDNSISEMAFNENGSLVATADCLGQEINVFQIIPQIQGEEKGSYQHLYKLIRGASSAIIESISFNTSSQWISVCSARGTTHIFPINLSGQAPTIYTHGGVDDEYHEKKLPTEKKPVIVQSIERIHQPSCITPDEQELSKLAISSFKTPIVMKFLTHYDEISSDPPETSQSYACLIVNPFATMTLVTLTPYVHVAVSNNQETKELKMKSEYLYEWNLSRPPSSGEVKNKILYSSGIENTNHKKLSNSRWLSQVEVSTYEPLERPIWMNPQFVFKTYQPVAKGEYDGESATIITEGESDSTEDIPAKKLQYRWSEPIPHAIRNEESESEDMRSAFSGSLEYATPPKNGFNFESEALHINSDLGFTDDVIQSDEEEETNLSDSGIIQSPDGNNEVDSPDASHMQSFKRS